jgi:hypothetical protein
MAEAETMVVDATKFARGFGRYQHEANMVDVIEVRSHGHVIGGYLSAKELQHYRRLKRREREVLVVGQLPDEVIADLEAAEYGAEPR